MILFIALAVACAVSCIFVIFYCIRKRTKQDNTQEITSGPGLQMRDIPYDSNPRYDASTTQSSVEQESGRTKVEIGELQNRTSTIENQTTESSRDSSIQKTQKVDSSDEEDNE